jgi:hypothetical protein
MDRGRIIVARVAITVRAAGPAAEQSLLEHEDLVPDPEMSGKLGR